MDVSEKILELLQKVDTSTEEGIQELLIISSRLDAYAEVSINKCHESYDALLKKRKILNEMIKDYFRAVEDSKSSTLTQESTDYHRAASSFIFDERNQLNDEFFSYLLECNNLQHHKFDADEITFEIEPGCSIIMEVDKECRIISVKDKEGIVLNSFELNEMLDKIYKTNDQNPSMFKDKVIAMLQHYLEQNFSQTTIYSELPR